MTDMDSKRATTKCIDTAMVCQLCYVPYSKSNNYSKLCKLGIVTAYMSVRLSVCLYCIKMHKVSITVTSSTDNLKTIFLQISGSSQNSKGLKRGWVGTNWRFSTFTLPYHRNRPKLLLITNRKSHNAPSDWYRILNQ